MENKAVAVNSAKTITLQIGSNILNNNGTEVVLDVPAQTINDRTMIPVRAIFEALGAEVSWNGDTQTVTAVWDDIVISLQIGSNLLYQNREAKELDLPAQLVDSRTLVPVRAVTESFGAEAGWNGDAQTVTIAGK